MKQEQEYPSKDFETENVFKNPPPIVALCEEYYLDQENPQSKQSLCDLIELSFKKAHEGDFEAQFLLGILYGSGIVLEKDSKKSFEWYEKSAKSGYIEAQTQVLSCYEIGEGVEQNRFMYLYWMEKIQNNGDHYERFHSSNELLNFDLNKNSLCEDGEIILRTSDGDLIASKEILKKCPFFINYLKKEWKPLSKEGGKIIIDLKSIENCFDFKLGPSLAMYLNFLKISPNSHQVCQLICQHSNLWDNFLHLLNFFSNDDCILFHHMNDPLQKCISTTLFLKFKNNYSFYLPLDCSSCIFIFKFTDGRIIAYNVYHSDTFTFQTFHDDCVESVTCLIPSQFK